jgi:hypothetical protein
MPVLLKLVEKYEDIKASVDLFNRDLQENEDLAQRILRSTTYWVYDPTAKSFGASKFVGFIDMNFSNYARAQKHDFTGARFNGTVAREAIERILGSFEQHDHLRYELVKWGESRFGTHVFSGTNSAKWQFVILRDLPQDQMSHTAEKVNLTAVDNHNPGGPSFVDSSSQSKMRLRIAIPSHVRREVWRRDEGKCVKCGSREKLEYDHIIPLSKGGSNTARNIELLCQDCNRSKSADIR